MKTRTLLASFLFLAAGLTVRADSHADALQKLSQLPSAPMIVTMDQATNSPKVTLTDKGAVINGGAPVPFDQVLQKLAALPASAWPWGRVILYTRTAAAPPQTADKVEADLQDANIRLLHGGG